MKANPTFIAYRSLGSSNGLPPESGKNDNDSGSAYEALEKGEKDIKTEE